MFDFHATDFLRNDWQRRPRMLRQAFTHALADVNGDDLAALAMAPESLSRLVQFDPRRKQYRLEHGPFDAERYANLPPRNWTLLVQDVDKWLPEVMAPLLANFGFLPRWRIEDVMISYAAPGGNVGPHIDQYDVFLVQASGHRKWSIDSRKRIDASMDPNAPLKLLKHFQPNKEWVLGPGDVLYLPPGVPHHGVAVDTCTTWSVGLRAPSDAELLTAMATALLDAGPEYGPDFGPNSGPNSGPDAARYSDPDLAAPSHWHELDGAGLTRIKAALTRALERMDAQFLAQQAGRFLCRYRSPRALTPRARPASAVQFERRLHGGARLQRNPWHRLLWTREGKLARLHCSELSVLLSIAHAEWLAGERGLDAADWAGLAPEARSALWQMHGLGILDLHAPAR